MDDLDHYTALFARHDVPCVALCVTVVGLADLDAALVRFGGFPADGRSASISDVDQWLAPAPLQVVVADRQEDWVLLVEANGYEGNRSAVLARLSSGTVAASLHWSVNSGVSLNYARDGRLLGTLDVGPAGTPHGAEPQSITGLLDDLDLERSDPRAVGLTALERLSGIRLSAAWLLTAHPASAIVPFETFDDAGHLDALLPEAHDQHRWPESRGGAALSAAARTALAGRARQQVATLRRAADLAIAGLLPDGESALPDASALAGPERSRLRAELLTAARQSYRDGVTRYWDAIDAEDDEEEPVGGGGIEELFAETLHGEAEEVAAQEALRRGHAHAAARGRLHADPRQALCTALHHAWQADPVGWPARQRRVTDLLTAEPIP